MSYTSKLLVGAAALLGVLLPAAKAQAQCCTGYMAATACNGVALTKSRWCIQNTVPTGQAALPQEFCAFGDKVVNTLETLFNIKAPEIFEFQLDTATGGAHTGTSCGRLGDGVAYDAFVGSAYGATGFWGYLLALHEAINDWTGMSSSGWPTDWWADHQSAFPNLMDFHIMNTIGAENNDQNLIKAAAAQKKRFYPNGDSADAKVVALDNVFGMMPGGDGYAGFAHMFAMQSGDGVKWDNLGVPNPSVKRSEYVVAYMSLAAGVSTLKTLQGPGANNGGNICNNTPDGTPSDTPYTCSQANIDAIATAHCAIIANGKKAADLTTFRGGTYATIASGPCGATCPSECGCDSASHCVAPWLGTVKPNDAGIDSGKDSGGAGGASGAAGAAGTGGAGGSAGGAGGASGSAGATGGASGSAGATGGASGSAGSAGATGGAAGASGSMSVGGAAGGASGAAGSGVGGVAGVAGSPNAGGAQNPGAAASGTDSGCSCRVAGDTGRPSPLVLLGLSALAGLVLGRRRARRP
jgi:MYXO-CTERM domain-containing protein